MAGKSCISTSPRGYPRQEANCSDLARLAMGKLTAMILDLGGGILVLHVTVTRGFGDEACDEACSKL